MWNLGRVFNEDLAPKPLHHWFVMGPEVKQSIPYFGERALLYQEPRAATVKVLSEAQGQVQTNWSQPEPAV